MCTKRTWILAAVVFGSVLVLDAMASPPTCTVHFFDWYVVSDQTQLAEVQKRWTYQVDWQRLGIVPEDIGNTVHYYEVQCRKIREAGFDGIHYEWHGNPVKPQFSEALRKTGVPMAMFYDMEIRFSGRPQFITPTDEFAGTFVNDVASFYDSVPKELWLHDRNGCLPIVVYGYQFDGRVTDPDAWDRFYRAIISGVEERLGEQVVFHWTNNGTLQQMYGYQHFPEIQSYIFNEVGQQTPVNAHSVTFVVHYDDLGVSFARSGPRARGGSATTSVTSRKPCGWPGTRIPISCSTTDGMNCTRGSTCCPIRSGETGGTKWLPPWSRTSSCTPRPICRVR